MKGRDGLLVQVMKGRLIHETFMGTIHTAATETKGRIINEERLRLMHRRWVRREATTNFFQIVKRDVIMTVGALLILLPDELWVDVTVSLINAANRRRPRLEHQ